jgi:hypothetical protein
MTALPCAVGPAEPTGLRYCQTLVPAGVTSKKFPFVPSQISVFPFGRRCALEILLEKKLVVGVALYVQMLPTGANVAVLLAGCVYAPVDDTGV